MVLDAQIQLSYLQIYAVSNDYLLNRLTDATKKTALELVAGNVRAYFESIKNKCSALADVTLYANAVTLYNGVVTLISNLELVDTPDVSVTDDMKSTR